VGKNPRFLKSGEHSTAFYREMWDTLVRGEHWRGRFVNRRKDGTLYDVDATIAPVVDSRGCMINYVAVVRDITERKRAEEALQESEVKYRSLVESASAVPCKLDIATGRFTYMGQQIEELLGYPMSSWVGFDTWSDRIHPEDREQARAYCMAATSRGEDHEFEYRAIAADGRHVWIRDVVSVIMGEQGPKEIIGFMFDITERKRAEEKAHQLQADLAHMSRLSTMGEMASGLAHELNQPLTVITNYAQGCVRRLKSNAISEDELEDILHRIATQARRSGSIIRGLGNLVRKSSALRTDIDVNQSIMEVAELANAEAAQHHAKARFELEPNLPLVTADQTQLQQVILNLVQNGCEAIEDLPTPRREVTVRTKRRGDSQLEIAVCDYGAGIPKAFSERLFEPFFTTKAQGIGMGLAISRSIVESHGGRLWATPNRDEGTTFHFTLPIVGGHGGDE
jgi:PAS domain S-box-containing protein